ncbi:hypothetical protein ABEB36_012521 [Hypothenemus hampei]|uniref:Uncharacterized protein n=1 Tax=Hypothenemus hampei TaxID=57062 RepID=A0ABD1EDJ6_HYPHA
MHIFIINDNKINLLKANSSNKNGENLWVHDPNSSDFKYIPNNAYYIQKFRYDEVISLKRKGQGQDRYYCSSPPITPVARY